MHTYIHTYMIYTCLYVYKYYTVTRVLIRTDWVNLSTCQGETSLCPMN